MFEDLIEMSTLTDRIAIASATLKCRKATSLAEAQLAAVKLATAIKMMKDAGLSEEEVAAAKTALGIE